MIYPNGVPTTARTFASHLTASEDESGVGDHPGAAFMWVSDKVSRGRNRSKKLRVARRDCCIS